MLHHALNLELVILPGESEAWPAPLSLNLALNEVLLIEGAGPAASLPLLEVAATLAHPVTGQVRHWGRNPFALRREDLYRLRRRIAYISPRPVLLQLLTLGENIALGLCYYQGRSEFEALEAHRDLLELLDLGPHLDQQPSQVSAAVQARAVWARELVKEPELILAVMSGVLASTAGAALLVGVLRDYLARRRAAALLLGESLEPFYHLGQRLLKLESGQLRKRPLPEQRPRPLTAYLPLV